MKEEKKTKEDYGMTGEEIFEALNKSLEIKPENAKLHMDFAHIQMLWLHARALSAHCECLGYNAENAISVCNNSRPPFGDIDYNEVVEKYGLVDEKGNSII